jgi:hypothetical protein
MRKLTAILMFLMMACLVLGVTVKYTLTIDSGKVISTESDFPFLVTEANLHTSFFEVVDYTGSNIKATATDGTLWPHEVSYIDKDNKKISLWIKCPSISSSVDTSFYLYAGSSATNDPTTVWNNGYIAVRHLDSPDTDGSYPDSVSSSYASYATGTITANTGAVQGGVTLGETSSLGLFPPAGGYKMSDRQYFLDTDGTRNDSHPAHMQGICTDGTSIYSSWTSGLDALVTYTLSGVKQFSATPTLSDYHHGSPCYYNGSIYFPAYYGSLGADPTCTIEVYNTCLVRTASYDISSLCDYGVGAMDYHDGYFYVGEARPQTPAHSIKVLKFPPDFSSVEELTVAGTSTFVQYGFEAFAIVDGILWGSTYDPDFDILRVDLSDMSLVENFDEVASYLPQTGFTRLDNDTLIGATNVTREGGGYEAFYGFWSVHKQAEPSAGFTYSFWFKPSYLPSAQTNDLNRYLQYWSGRVEWIGINSDYALIPSVDGSGTGPYLSQSYVAEDVWNYITLRYDPSTPVLDVWVNDTQYDPHTAQTANIVITNSLGPLMFGQNSTEFGLDGDVGYDEAHFSHVSRSDGWIQTTYNNQSSPSTFCWIIDSSLPESDGEPLPTEECSAPPFMDSNGDCKVDIIDFHEFAREWMACPFMDSNGDCKVDLIDFFEFAGEWMACGLENQSECWE